jgi:hypothetical protein
VNPNNATSITAFYENIFLLASNFFLVNAAIDFATYKASFQTVGALNDGLKLAELRSLCGNACYSEVLHLIYQFIDNNLKNTIGDSETWASKVALPTSC